ncbi:hypothetical protein PIB30_012218 [Stylosanthes scabra]|uniref:F-box/LRR-repeat protein 15/At3g58940/PEG3-like LRR domain-containing protein n=1 Tax=Stylosanthes scabra TaxID=79078 RepID=A0ABU6U7M9_9FABA|nr:hypothetical protein [Stylosanthes scabra]
MLSCAERIHLSLSEPNKPNPPPIGERYRFPLTSILESKSLVFLILDGYFRLDESLFITTHPITMFPSLKSLSLRGVYVNDAQVLHYLVSSCPMIENLTSNNCSGGLEYVRIQNLPKLKKFLFRGPQEVGVHLAPSLELFQYTATGSNGAPYIDTTTLKSTL